MYFYQSTGEAERKKAKKAADDARKREAQKAADDARKRDEAQKAADDARKRDEAQKAADDARKRDEAQKAADDARKREAQKAADDARIKAEQEAAEAAKQKEAIAEKIKNERERRKSYQGVPSGDIDARFDDDSGILEISQNQAKSGRLSRDDYLASMWRSPSIRRTV